MIALEAAKMNCLGATLPSIQVASVTLVEERVVKRASS